VIRLAVITSVVGSGWWACFREMNLYCPLHESN
jgi:hypothetical protein